MKNKEYEVIVSYPEEILVVDAESKEEAENKALEMLGDVLIRAEKEATAEATEI
jgi:hypothetical protein